MTKPDEKPALYMHINNGGISFILDDTEDGAYLVVRAGHFGIQTNEMRIPVTRGNLRKFSYFFKDLAELPLHQPKHDYIHLDCDIRGLSCAKGRPDDAPEDPKEEE